MHKNELGSQRIRGSGEVLMQTKGGGKHDILPVGRPSRDHARLYVNDAPRSRCGHVPRHHHGVGEHGGVHGASELRYRGSGSPPSRRSRALSRTIVGSCIIKQWRRTWLASKQISAQLGGQDKKPHIAARSVDWKTCVFWTLAHIAAHLREVCNSLLSNGFNDYRTSRATRHG